MLIEDAYLIMFHILNDYYIETKNNNSLGSLLSDMDPYLYEDRTAADPALYDDWYNVMENYIKKGEVKKEVIKVALIDFLTYYQNEFGYELKEVILHISNMDVNKSNNGRCK